MSTQIPFTYAEPNIHVVQQLTAKTKNIDVIASDLHLMIIMIIITIIFLFRWKENNV